MTLSVVNRVPVSEVKEMYVICQYRYFSAYRRGVFLVVECAISDLCLRIVDFAGQSFLENHVGGFSVLSRVGRQGKEGQVVCHHSLIRRGSALVSKVVSDTNRHCRGCIDTMRCALSGQRFVLLEDSSSQYAVEECWAHNPKEHRGLIRPVWSLWVMMAQLRC